MRASDIVRGKIQSLRNRAIEEKPAGAAGDLLGKNPELTASPYKAVQERKDGSAAIYRLRDDESLDLIAPPAKTLVAHKTEESGIGSAESDSSSGASKMDISPEENHKNLQKQENRETIEMETTTSAVAPEDPHIINAEQEAQVTETIKNASTEAPDQPPVEQESLAEEEKNNVKVLYQRAQAYLQDVHEKVNKNETIDIDSAISIIHNVMELHYDLDAEIYQMTVDFGHGDDYFFAHAINTAIYAVRIGQRLGYTEKVLMILGVSALLCDIGMFKIPDTVLNKQGKLTQQEIDLIKKHPQFSQNILLPFSREYPDVVEMVLEHQERENGQGYPRGLKGSEIMESAKIIGICDSYEAMTHNRPHKKALMQTDSIRELIGSKNQLFSPRIIKTFLDEISIFPVGSYVRLNNKHIGRVIATNRSNPLKPTIKILFDEKGKAFSETKIIDLKANPVLNVEGSVAQDELPR